MKETIITRNAIPGGMILFVALVSFYIGFSWGSGNLNKYKKRADKAKTAYSELVEERKKKNKDVATDQGNKETAIDQKYDAMLVALREDIKNSQKKVMKYDAKALDITEKMKKIKLSMKSATPEKKAELEEVINKKQKELDGVLAERLSAACTDAPVYWGDK